MKKLVVISIVAAMLLTIAVAAMASSTTWTLALKATDINGQNFNTSANIGCMTGYTEGIDTSKGEPGTVGAAGPGSTLASVVALSGSTAMARDFRAPVVEGQTVTWSVKLYVDSLNGPALNGYKLTLTPGTGSYVPGFLVGATKYELKIKSSIIPDGVAIFDANNAMPVSFNYSLTQAMSAPIMMDVTFAPVVPEPSSLLALASGLAGLGGFAIRRRRA